PRTPFRSPGPGTSPDGPGPPNAKGLDFYSRLVDELLAAGIEPFATLYHWDLPQALQDKGGWQSREIPQAFADYAGYVAEQLGDRVKHVFTINEFRSFVDFGHRGMESEIGGSQTDRVLIAPALVLSAGGRKPEAGGGQGFGVLTPPARVLSGGELNQVRHHAVLAHGLAAQAIRAR